MAGESQPGSRAYAQTERRRFRQRAMGLGVSEPVAAYLVRRTAFRSVNDLARDAAKQASDTREEASELRMSCELEEGLPQTLFVRAISLGLGHLDSEISTLGTRAD